MDVGRTAIKSYLQAAQMLVFLALPSCALIGIGGGEAENLKHAKGYSVSPPAGWNVIAPQEGDRAYRLASGNVVTLASDCSRDTNPDLELMTRHLLLGDRSTVIVRRQRLSVDGAEGLFSDVETRYEGKPFRLNVFVLPKEGCIFDFSLVSPKGIGAAETQEFLSFVKSFHYGNRKR